MLPVIIQELFKRSSDVHKYSTRQSQTFYVPICRTTAFSKTIKFKGVNIWNNLITKINPNCSISTFKYHLKKYLSKYRTDRAKILGVTISADLTWNAHVNNIVFKASKHLYYMWCQLKRAGVDQRDLVRIYMSVI